MNRKTEHLSRFITGWLALVYFSSCITLIHTRRKVIGDVQMHSKPKPATALLSGPTGVLLLSSAKAAGQSKMSTNPKAWCSGSWNTKNLQKVCLCFVNFARCHGPPQELAPVQNTGENVHNSVIHGNSELETLQCPSAGEWINQMWSKCMKGGHWASETCWVKEFRCIRLHIGGFHLCEISRKGKPRGRKQTSGRLGAGTDHKWGIRKLFWVMQNFFRLWWWLHNHMNVLTIIILEF